MNVYVISEIGINHNGDLELAKKMILESQKDLLVILVILLLRLPPTRHQKASQKISTLVKLAV